MNVTYKTEEIMNLVDDWTKSIFEDKVSVQMKSGPNTIFFIQAGTMMNTDTGIFVITRRMINENEATNDIIFLIPSSDFVNRLTIYKIVKADLMFDFIDVTDEPEFQLTEELNSMIGELVNQILITYLGEGEEKKEEIDNDSESND